MLKKPLIVLAIIIWLSLLAASLAGCLDVITPRTRAMIDDTADNARVFAGALEAGAVTDDPTAPVPQYVITWVNAEADQWEYMLDLACWRKPSDEAEEE